MKKLLVLLMLLSFPAQAQTTSFSAMPSMTATDDDEVFGQESGESVWNKIKLSAIKAYVLATGHLTVAEEGTPVDTDYTTLNFVGSGVTATDATGTATITINAVVPSGAGSESLILGPTDCTIAATATGTGDVAIGCDSSASSSTVGDTAIGYKADANGNKTTAIGHLAAATNTNAVAIGDNATASGVKSFASGNQAVASGDNSIALGNQTDATALGAIAMGDAAQATHGDAVAIGHSATSTAADQVVFAADYHIVLPYSTEAAYPAAGQAGFLYNNDDDTLAISDGSNWGNVFSDFDPPKQAFCVAMSDETTAISSTGTSITFLPVPYDMRIIDVTLDLGSATTTGIVTVDINEDAVSLLTTKLTVDATETTSATAANPPVGHASALIDAGDRIWFDFDGIGDGTATGAKVCLVVSQDWL